MNSFWAMYSLRMSFCSVPPSFARGMPRLLRRRDEHRPDRRRRAVDRHRDRDLIERDAVEQDLHVGQRGDADAALAELARGDRLVGVVAHQRGQIEGHAQAVLAVGEQVEEARVRLLGAAEAGELANRPRPAAVAGRVDAARVGRLTRQPEVTRRLDAARGEVGLVVEPLDRARGDGPERPGQLAALGRDALLPGAATLDGVRVFAGHARPPRPQAASSCTSRASTLRSAASAVETPSRSASRSSSSVVGPTRSRSSSIRAAPPPA